MAKANLPVNFKDDILKENMNGKRRFNMIQNSDGTVSFEDVTDYTQVGSTFGAAQINATNEAVNNAADASKIIDSLDTIKANTQAGYMAGALAVKELNSNLSNLIGTMDGSSTVTFTYKKSNKYIMIVSTGNGTYAKDYCAIIDLTTKTINGKIYDNGQGWMMVNNGDYSSYIDSTNYKITVLNTGNSLNLPKKVYGIN